MEKEIKVLVVEPHKRPSVYTISNELEALQQIVGGYIEVVSLTDDVCIICNEEGKINGLDLNRALVTDDGRLIDIIAGKFLITGDDYETGEFISLTDEQIEYYTEKYCTSEHFAKVGNMVKVIHEPVIGVSEI